MFALTNKVAIVTGASSGIGRATASCSPSKAPKSSSRRDGRPSSRRSSRKSRRPAAKRRHWPATSGTKPTPKRWSSWRLREFGGLDIAFNNAGIVGDDGAGFRTFAEAWRDTLDTNLTSAFLGAKYQVPAMVERGGGSLIFTSTFVGHTVGMPGMTAYAASKAGLIGLTQVLAAEFGPKGVRVNALLPGGTDTPASITNAPGAGPEVLAFVEGLHALKRIARPEEIARSALYLASDASSFTTGDCTAGRRRGVDQPDLTIR